VKILICYHSQSGNTEKIARAIAGGLESEDVTILPATEVDAAGMNDYDLVILGSGVYAGKVGTSILDLVKNAFPLTTRLAFFTTHANPDPGMWQNAFKRIRRDVEKSGSTVVAEFDCTGENRVIAEEKLLSVYQGDRETIEAHIESTRGHPNEEDEENARAFARSLVSPE
jgi:flavodoxin